MGTPLILGDRIMVRTTTEGQGSLAILGPVVPGYQLPTQSRVTNGVRTTWLCRTPDWTLWEEFEGVLDTSVSPWIVTRQRLIDNSAKSGQYTSWPAGEKILSVAMMAERIPYFDTDGQLLIPGGTQNNPLSATTKNYVDSQDMAFQGVAFSRIESRAAAFADDRLAQAKSYSDSRLESRGAQIAAVYADDRLAQAKSYSDSRLESRGAEIASAYANNALASANANTEARRRQFTVQNANWGGTYDLVTGSTSFIAIGVPASTSKIIVSFNARVENTNAQAATAVFGAKLMAPGGGTAISGDILRITAKTSFGSGGAVNTFDVGSIGSGFTVEIYGFKDTNVGPFNVYEVYASLITIGT